MSTLTLRIPKGSPLTNAEVDANFTNILVALGGANTSPYTIPTPTGTGSPVLSDSPTITGTLTTTDLNSTSDIKLKENVQKIENGLELINALNPVSFDWIQDGKTAYGLIAQEVESVLPDLVSTDNDTKSIKYLQLISFMINAIQQQNDMIQSLNSRLEIIEGK